MNRILFHELAKIELIDARDFYDEHMFGLGEIFVEEIERSINIIKSNPKAFPIIKDSIHKAVIMKFPYSILYRVEKESIFILAVMHQKRKPSYWSERR